MTAHVTVGMDESPESLAAALWAAEEASLLGVGLRLIHVEEWPVTAEVPVLSAESLVERYETLLRATADRVRSERPGLDVTTEMARGRAPAELTAAANESEVTVLGSRGLGGVVGFLIGSVSLAVVGRARRPVVLVRSPAAGPPASAAGADGAGSGIVLGVDIDSPCDPLLAFAFGEAARRDVELRVLHSWSPSPAFGYTAILDPGVGSGLGRKAADGLAEMLRPWRSKFPAVRVTERVSVGPAAAELVDASRSAGLLVVGRRSRRSPVGPHLGHVAHAVIHHSPAPVAVVPFE
ncbi:universal stress protein [Streptomyces sp. NPDC012389]|uniref:universal stress protein n=1 Tax=unclassified Streptomyces TaxID=2593676 RepID=UPI00081DCDFF|nr:MULTISPECIES: universal stress protein [unclassified Streptomyces]MYR98278.1 universal stress protein [Streptomyces sp. SID4937]MYX12025.1 universal stress protein [Streptomyces sp. SID8374]SCE36207.1 Nucleotide-binding universal stress protein, UspA family [Streptomyces sp. ScaeMP-e83]